MAYDASAAKTSHAAEMCSPRTRATTHHATAPTSETAVQIATDRARVACMSPDLPCGLTEVRYPTPRGGNQCRSGGPPLSARGGTACEAAVQRRCTAVSQTSIHRLRRVARLA